MASGHGHGSMSLSMKFIRLLIVCLNLTFVVIGAIVLAIGIYVMKDPKIQQLRPLLNPQLISAHSHRFSDFGAVAILLIVVGSILLILGFLGCCGAIKGFRFLHCLYAFIVGIIIIAEIAIIIIFIVYQNRFRTEFVARLQDSIVKFYVGIPTGNSSSPNPVSLSWDFVQHNLHCCGAVSKQDFLHAKHWNRKNPYYPTKVLVVPFTCCPLGGSENWTQLPTNWSAASNCANTGANAYTKGCYDRLTDILVGYKHKIFVGAVVVGVVETLAVIFAILLYCRKEDYKSF